MTQKVSFVFLKFQWIWIGTILSVWCIFKADYISLSFEKSHRPLRVFKCLTHLNDWIRNPTKHIKRWHFLFWMCCKMFRNLYLPKNLIYVREHIPYAFTKINTTFIKLINMWIQFSMSFRISTPDPLLYTDCGWCPFKRFYRKGVEIVIIYITLTLNLQQICIYW